MPTNQVDGRSALRGLLAAVNDDLGAPIAPAWEEAFWALPRHAFLPDTVWVGDGLEECSRQVSPKDWLGHAYEDDAVVTQINDGQDPGDGERWASCSASAPSIVFRMLDMLDVSAEHNVLEIGTGTGWNSRPAGPPRPLRVGDQHRGRPGLGRVGCEPSEGGGGSAAGGLR